MYSIEFMVLYLAEIIMAALVLLTAYLLIRLVFFTAGLIRKIIKKGGENYNEQSQNNTMQG